MQPSLRPENISRLKSTLNPSSATDSQSVEYMYPDSGRDVFHVKAMFLPCNHRVGDDAVLRICQHDGKLNIVCFWNYW